MWWRQEDEAGGLLQVCGGLGMRGELQASRG